MNVDIQIVSFHFNHTCGDIGIYVTICYNYFQYTHSRVDSTNIEMS